MGLLERLVPDLVATAETSAELVEVPLFPSEREVILRAVEKRRHEFITGRACARMALQRLGVAPAPIGKGAHGEPLWPQGVVGSITHCRPYRACAVATDADVTALGIDAEPNLPLPRAVFERIAFGQERALIPDSQVRQSVGAGNPAHDVRADRCGISDTRREVACGARPVCLDRLLFCAKEAVYKAWFPIAQRWLDFADVEVTIDIAVGSFRARMLSSGVTIGSIYVTEFDGRWEASGGVICAAVVLRKPPAE